MNFENEQQIYDYVGEFLINQGKRSIFNGLCRYRGSNGMKCAVGAVIPDESYNEEMDIDSLGIHTIINRFDLPEYISEFVYFFSYLQEFHDRPINWTDEGLNIKNLILFGKHHNLDTSKFEIYLVNT